MLIMECPIKNWKGLYFPHNDLIVVNNIKDIMVLLHEVTHKLFKERNSKLRKYLNYHGLDFDNINYEFLSFCCERLPYLVEVYDKNCLYEECVCIYMEAHLPEELLKLNIKEYNQIINGEFDYANQNGDIINNKSGDWIDWSPDAQRIANDIKELF